MKKLLDRIVFLSKSKPFKKGFTLTELLVVVLVMGVLAAVALPVYTKSVKKSRASEALRNLDMVSLRQSDYVLNDANGEYATSLSDLNLPWDIAADEGKFSYTLNEACVSVKSEKDSYTITKNVETQDVGCSGGDCKLFAGVVPEGGVESCAYTGGNDDGTLNPGSNEETCERTCSDGVTKIYGTKDPVTGDCKNLNWSACPTVEPEVNNICNDGDTTVKEDNCDYVCNNNAWTRKSVQSGNKIYISSSGRCVAQTCPSLNDGYVLKNTGSDGIHYCKVYKQNIGAFEPSDWSKKC